MTPGGWGGKFENFDVKNRLSIAKMTTFFKKKLSENAIYFEKNIVKI